MSMLLDSVLATALLAGSIVQLDMQHLRSAERNVAISTGQYLNGLQAGLNKYIAVNGDTLAGRSPGPYVDPNNNPIALANPLAPTVAELQRFGFLPPGYTANNPSRLTFAIAIERSGCPGSGCTLPATIRTSQYRDLQGNVRNDLAAFVMQAAGLDGGQALPSNPGMFTGAGGSWQLPNASNTVGAIAMRAGSLTTGYVDTLPFYKLDGSRALTGTMQANGQNISGAGAVSANTVSLPAGNSLTIGDTQWYGDGWNAAIRTNGDLYVQGPNGVGARSINAGNGNFDGNAWVRGTADIGQVNANNAQVWGSANVNGTMWANQLGANDANVGGTMAANQVNANGVNVWGNQVTHGAHYINGALVAQNMVYLPALAWEGYGCGGNGITTDPEGKILSCQSGVWRSVASRAGVTDAQVGYACVGGSTSTILTIWYADGSTKQTSAPTNGAC